MRVCVHLFRRREKEEREMNEDNNPKNGAND
jgi:hypothetical protein